MKLIVILICLGLERYAKIGNVLKRWVWYDLYIKQLQAWFKKETYWQGWNAIVLILVPLLLVVGIVYYAFNNLLFNFVGLIFDVIVLLYCLGPEDLYYQLQAYFAAVDEGDEQQQTQGMAQLLGGSKKAEATQANNRTLTIAIFRQANERLFAVVFWFILLGPLGAVLYRLVVETCRKEGATNYLVQAQLLQQVLDWIPIRLTGLIYFLVGHFTEGFRCWLQGLGQGLAANQTFLANCSLAALGVKKEDSHADVEENRQAVGMLDRALIVVLVVIAIFTLGAWIY